MGTDIHAQLEVKLKGSAGWIWPFAALPPCIRKEQLPACVFPTNRSYHFFAMLADVRNGHGFAGVSTGTGFEPAASPRGLPADISSELLAAHEEDGILGDHSFSWLTNADLLAYGKRHFDDEGAEEVEEVRVVFGFDS